MLSPSRTNTNLYYKIVRKGGTTFWNRVDIHAAGTFRVHYLPDLLACGDMVPGSHEQTTAMLLKARQLKKNLAFCHTSTVSLELSHGSLHAMPDTEKFTCSPVLRCILISAIQGCF